MQTEEEKKAFDAFSDNYNALHKENLKHFVSDMSILAEHKARLLSALLPFKPAHILDFGCGIGNNLPYLLSYFPEAEICGCDISEKSLQLVNGAFPQVRTFLSDELASLKAYARVFDLVFVANVFHHIPPEERSLWFAALAETLRPGGAICVFEQNPWNPVTRYIIKTCPFDEGVTLVRAGDCVRFLNSAGLTTDPVRYTFIFPFRKPFFVKIENALQSLPLGCQYYILAYSPTA